MATLRGYITFVGGSKPWQLTLTDGQNMGNFVSVGDAENVLSSKIGKRIDWTPPRPTDPVQRYIGSTSP